MRQLFLVAIGISLAFSCGCRRSDSSPAQRSGTPPSPRAAVQLTLLIVDDPELATAASALRGEWAERSGGELVVQQMTLAEMLAVEQILTDVIVYPSRFVGTLVARDWLRPVRDSVLENDDFVLEDLFPLVRNESMRYAGQIFGVSLGESPLMLARQASTEEDFGAIADTWEKLDQFALKRNQGDVAAELIARAASYVDRQDRAELLFDPQSMSARLTSPPVVHALESMVSQVSDSEREALPIRITWPTSEEFGGDPPWQFATLPSAASTYNAVRQRWEPLALERSLTVLGFAGRTVSVTRSSRNATSAFKLLAWLTTGNAAVQLSSRGNDTVWFRNSQKSRSSKWLADRGTEQSAPLVTKLLLADRFFLLPRIPGIDQYLETLSEAAGSALSGDSTPAKALESAAARWDELTEELGQSEQRLAYRRHLGLVELAD